MLRGQKVVLTALWDDDSDLLYEWINEPELVRMNSTYRPVDKAVHREWS